VIPSNTIAQDHTRQVTRSAYHLHCTTLISITIRTPNSPTTYKDTHPYTRLIPYLPTTPPTNTHQYHMDPTYTQRTPTRTHQDPTHTQRGLDASLGVGGSRWGLGSNTMGGTVLACGAVTALAQSMHGECRASGGASATVIRGARPTLAVYASRASHRGCGARIGRSYRGRACKECARVVSHGGTTHRYVCGSCDDSKFLKGRPSLAHVALPQHPRNFFGAG
jgi:hypothetical protein